MQKPLLELRHLNAIVILSEELSYTQAAIRLGMSQSARPKTLPSQPFQGGVDRCRSHLCCGSQTLDRA
jgi:hypothetical protein